MDPERLKEVPWEALAALADPVLRAVAEIFRGAAADRVLDRLLRSYRTLQAEQRAAIAEAVFGVALWRRRLAWHAGGDWRTADPRALLFALVRDLGGRSSEAAAAIVGQPELSALAVRPPPVAFADRFSFPDWLADLLQRELGGGAADFAAAINVPGPVCLRTNSLRTNREMLRISLEADGISSEPCRFAPAGLVVHGRPTLFGTVADHNGLFEAQDEGSQLLGELVGARRGEAVLDLCAGAGGKTLLLAAAMRNTGELYAYDVDLERLGRLELRARRAGVKCIRILREDVPPDLVVDRVLVDAPCSELGALRRGPDVRWRIEPSVLDTLPPLQAQLLDDAATHVRPGGRLVYATCTIDRAENEDVALAFEARHPSFRRTRPGEGWLDESFVSGGFFHAWPHVHGTDGFFAAVWTAPGSP